MDGEFYYRKAKAEKFRSRAAYKLLQAVKKYNFIRPDYLVVDLGAAPGGWMCPRRLLPFETSVLFRFRHL